MASIFSKTNSYVDKPKRNVFDLSFSNNLTVNMGNLYPVFCKEVIPGDSFNIKPSFGFNMMPMAFPVQTRMQVNLHFFYVRNRNLWKDWMDFIGKTKDNLVPPYLANPYKMCSTGGLLDYLGVPTTLYGRYGTMTSNPLKGFKAGDGKTYNYMFYKEGATAADMTKENIVGKYASSLFLTTQKRSAGIYGVKPDIPDGFFNKKLISKELFFTASQKPIIGSKKPWLIFIGAGGYCVDMYQCDIQIENDKLCKLTLPETCDLNELNDKLLFGVGDKSTWKPLFGVAIVSDDTNICSDSLNDSTMSNHHSFVSCGFEYLASVVDVNSDPTYFPYYDSVVNPDSDLKISALPVRGYKSICHAFYLNQQNDPFKIGGKPEYNKFLENVDGGADNLIYDFSQRNWEQDYLTTCMPSPQQGIAPLVGITTRGEMTFADDNGEYKAQAQISEDGDTITGFSIKSPDMPEGNRRQLVNLATSGIAISDLRNVNSLQRWLETNMRRGFRYKDQIMSHYGVDVSYEELDMPEFLGGMSEPITINKITQTSSSVDGSPLGDYAGQGSVFAESKHSISKYFDEHGFVIGILSISPVPNYSQLLPKHFIKDHALDYFFPEFGHIGMQPITYREVCPVQAWQAGKGKELSKTFGYQRAWYEYMASTDEVHGLFRSNLRDFLINRTFDTPPELGHDFLTIHPDDVNDIFTITDVSDKFVGEVYFKVTAKRPIPMFGIPRIE